jgi:hypothetical protein
MVWQREKLKEEATREKQAAGMRKETEEVAMKQEANG